MNEAKLQRLRAETPGTAECIHLNNAGAALVPTPVLQVTLDHLTLEHRIGGYEAAQVRHEQISTAYETVAKLLGCRARNIAFTPSATHSYAQALSAMSFEAGDVILTTTDDYVSNQIMLLSLARRHGVRIERAKNTTSGEVDVQDIRRRIEKTRPKLVAVTHVPTNSGLVQPVAAIGDVCAEHEVTSIVDACQSVGQLQLDVNQLHCDYLSATSRKFLRGPRGFGFLYVSDRVLDGESAPLLPDLRSATWIADDEYRLKPDATRFEYWEQPYGLLLATGEAARYAQEVGLDEIESRVAILADETRAQLTAAGLDVLDRGTRKCGIVTVALPGKDAETVYRQLLDRHINTCLSVREFARLDFGKKGIEWALRISPHYYNSREEIDQALGEIIRIAQS